MNTNTCTFVQQALAESWDDKLEFLEPYRQTLEQRRANLATWIASEEKLSAVVPKAGFFMFIDISALKMSSNDFCANLLKETGVATTPGLAFGEDWDDHFRLSFAVADKVLLEAQEKISNFIKHL